MNNIKRKPRHYALLLIFCSIFVLGSCGYGKNEVDYENEIEAAENEVGDPMLKENENLSDTTDSDQPARIDGQEGHPAPPTEEDHDYNNSPTQ